MNLDNEKLTNEEKYNLKENAKRNKILSNIGIGLSILGGILFGIGFLGAMSGDPSFFAVSFVGMVILMIGQVLFSLFGRGRMARFYAQQTAPVRKDVANYMIDGTKDSVVSVVKEIKGEGITKRACLSCGAINDINNKFCGNCGKELPK